MELGAGRDEHAIEARLRRGATWEPLAPGSLPAANAAA